MTAANEPARSPQHDDATHAFLGWSDGRLLLGHGPFKATACAPDHGVAFYVNDYGLSNPTPWQIPRETEWLDPSQIARRSSDGSALSVDWQTLDATTFAAVFQEITESIRAGKFEKTVPAAVEHGHLRHGDGRQWMSRAMNCPSPLVPYGFGNAAHGFVGHSPEYLLRVDDQHLHTMALAGTARAEERDVLAVDEKEIREHEFVAQALVSKLGDLGDLQRGERSIMALGPIVHFHTPIEVELKSPVSIDALIQRLHPTPALGPLPKTPWTMEQLVAWRQRLSVPAAFGAPFGAVVDGHFQGIVAIRGIWWHDHDIRLPAGCGVIEASRLVNEWRELRLKRDAVKERFGLLS